MMPPDSPDAEPTTVGPSSTQAEPQVLAGTAAAVAPVPLGVDVSHWQGPINWTQVAASGQKFAVMKAIEATGRSSVAVDPTLSTNLAGAHAAGLVVGAYAFARPQYPAVMQADAFASAIGRLPDGSLPPVLDLEVNGGLSVTALITWTHAFLSELEAKVGVPPMIYSGPSFWSSSMGGNTGFTRYPLWEAHYTTAAAPYAMGGWPTYTMWQYTSTGSVPGISGNVDRDRFNSATGASLSNLHLPVGVLNSVTADGTGRIALTGWAIDPDTPTTPAHVAVTLDSVQTTVTANMTRIDVGARYPLAGDAHGFATTRQANPGNRTVCVYALDTTVSTHRASLGCRTVTITPALPYGGIQSAVADGTGRIAVTGWTIDPDTLTTSTRVNVLVDGKTLATATANVSRPDIGAGHPGAGNLHGLATTVSTTPGTHTVCLDAIDTSFASLVAHLNCTTATVTPALPYGGIQSAVADGTGRVSLTGWTIDPDTLTTSTRVNVLVDGKTLATATANVSRPDIGAGHPGAGNLHGLATTVSTTPGTHTVCLDAIDTSFATLVRRLNCKTVTVTPRNPIGVYGSAVVDTAGHLTVSGWTFDPDTPTAPVRVKAYVDGIGLPSLLATVSRLDVARTYPDAGALHGFAISAQVSSGRHTVCVWAADTSFPTRTVQLGCRTVG
jgi:GH25 family lysozyme M1 (1,4-beta-N-acetylmuramidase)